MGDPRNPRAAAVNLARDLALKLVERRAVGPDQLAGGLSLLITAAENLFREIDDGRGLWLVRLARDFTLKTIECRLVASFPAAAAALAEYGRMAAQTAAGLDRDLAPAALNAAKDLTLKLLENGRLSRAGLPDLFAELARSIAEKP